MYRLIFWLPSLLFLIDWAQNKRALYWAYLLIALGPFGALAYLLYNYESITFPFPIARTLRELGRGRAPKTCPRCLTTVDRLEAVEDARQTHYMCPACAAQLESLRR